MAGNNAFNIAFLVSLTRNKIGGIFVGGALGAFLVLGLTVWMYLSFGWTGPLAMAGLGFLGASAEMLRRDQKRQRARRAAAEAAAEHADRRARFLPGVHWALDRLEDHWGAATLWASLGLGVLPANNVDPGMYPRVIGTEPITLGARVRLRILDGQAEKAFAVKHDELANGLKVPAVRIIEAGQQVLTLDLLVVDPLQQMNISPLIDAATADRIRDAVKRARNDAEAHELLTAACRDLQLRVPVGGLSVYDDIPIGPHEYGDMLTVNLASDDHLAVAGTTRAGKSVLIYDILAPAMLMRDCKVVLIDPNGATSPPWYQCAHLVCDTRDADAATEVLEEVMAEMERRQKLFYELQADKITRFSEELPLWLVVVEEASNFKDSAKFMTLLEKISAQAAKYGIKLEVIAQKMSGENVPTGARAQLSGRISLRVNDPADYRMLFPNAPQYAEDIQLKSKTPQGVGIASLPCHPDPIRFRALYLPTQACYAIGRIIVAARGAVRPAPAAAPESAPAQVDSNQTATDSGQPPVRKKPVPGFQLPQTASGPILPTIPQVGQQDGTVIPFDRTTRSDRPETTPPTGHTPPDGDTGTE